MVPHCNLLNRDESEHTLGLKQYTHLRKHWMIKSIFNIPLGIHYNTKILDSAASLTKYKQIITMG